MHLQRSKTPPPYLVCVLIATSLIVAVTSMDLFNVKFIELNDSLLIATSNYNYAFSSPRLLAKNWRAISVNGDSVIIITSGGERIVKSMTEFGSDKLFIESLRDEISSGNSGYNHVETAAGPLGGGMMMSSTTGGGGVSTSSFSSSANGLTSTTMGGGIGGGNIIQINDLLINMKDDNNFSVSKANFPFNWSKVFYNGELVTIVRKNGDVEMSTISSTDPVQLDALNKLKAEVKALQKSQSQQFTNTMQNSMDMVSNVFNSILGRLPPPPSYGSAVGNMFGDNFPFGPRNSPFGGSSGWPFGGGGAFAFAGRR